MGVSVSSELMRRWLGLRLRLTGVAVLLLALCGSAAAANADVQVEDAKEHLSAKVTPKPGPDGDNKLVVQRYLQLQFLLTPPPGNGMQVAGELFGPGVFSSSSAGTCARPPVGPNGVICGGRTRSVTLTMGDGVDTVELAAPLQEIEGVHCVNPPASATTATSIDLGGGNDTLLVGNTLFSLGCPPGGVAFGTGTTAEFEFDPQLTVHGEEGKDFINGSKHDDSLFGDNGDDELHGGDGNDTLTGGPGNDAMYGEFGNDLFRVEDSGAEGAPYDGADIFAGGPGADTVDYSKRTVPVIVNVGNGSSDDGSFGEQDEVVEADKVIGGSAADRLTGSAKPETLIGNAGNDIITGGPGEDNLQGGEGEDTINAIDGEADTVSCGPGHDHANLDLKDKNPIVFLGLPDCEFSLSQAVDDSPPGRPLEGAVRLRGRTATVRFRCPKDALPACKGRMVLSDPRHPGHVLAPRNYSIGLGRTASIKIGLRRSAVALLAKRRHVLVRTVEQGHSRVGPRGVSYTLRVSPPTAR